MYGGGGTSHKIKKRNLFLGLRHLVINDSRLVDLSARILAKDLLANIKANNLASDVVPN